MIASKCLGGKSKTWTAPGLVYHMNFCFLGVKDDVTRVLATTKAVGRRYLHSIKIANSQSWLSGVINRQKLFSPAHRALTGQFWEDRKGEQSRIFQLTKENLKSLH